MSSRSVVMFTRYASLSVNDESRTLTNFDEYARSQIPLQTEAYSPQVSPYFTFYVLL